jgi:hypothetical protein
LQTYHKDHLTFLQLDQNDLLIRYVKFYVAFKIAEGIVLGQIGDPSERKIFKYVFCVKLGR